MNPDFPPSSFTKVKLLGEPIYSDDREHWPVLLRDRPEIEAFFLALGQVLVVDEGEGYAYLRQMEIEGEERVPRLIRRMPLSYSTTLLLVCLREEFLRFDALPDQSGILVKSGNDLKEMLANFFPETYDRVRDENKLDTAITTAVKLGFLREMKGGVEGHFQIMPIVKARLGPEELVVIKEALKQHAEPSN